MRLLQVNGESAVTKQGQQAEVSVGRAQPQQKAAASGAQDKRVASREAR